MEEWLIPLVAILCGAGLPIILLMVVVVRTTRQRHEERMAMIEKGIVLEEPERRANKYGALRNGLLMVGLAFGAILGVSFVIYTVLGGGVAYLVYFFIVLKMMEKEKEQ